MCRGAISSFPSLFEGAIEYSTPVFSWTPGRHTGKLIFHDFRDFLDFSWFSQLFMNFGGGALSAAQRPPLVEKESTLLGNEESTSTDPNSIEK